MHHTFVTLDTNDSLDLRFVTIVSGFYVYALVLCVILVMIMLRLCVCLQVFFNPEIYSNDFTTSLPAVIDKCIQSAPIDTRRALYKV